MGVLFPFPPCLKQCYNYGKYGLKIGKRHRPQQKVQVTRTRRETFGLLSVAKTFGISLFSLSTVSPNIEVNNNSRTLLFLISRFHVKQFKWQDTEFL